MNRTTDLRCYYKKGQHVTYKYPDHSTIYRSVICTVQQVYETYMVLFDHVNTRKLCVNCGANLENVLPNYNI